MQNSAGNNRLLGVVEVVLQILQALPAVLEVGTDILHHARAQTRVVAVQAFFSTSPCFLCTLNGVISMLEIGYPESSA